MKLKNAAHATANRGRSTCVATIVATEFAASWNPLVKSKNSAIPITATTASSARSIEGVSCLRYVRDWP